MHLPERPAPWSAPLKQVWHCQQSGLCAAQHAEETPWNAPLKQVWHCQRSGLCAAQHSPAIASCAGTVSRASRTSSRGRSAAAWGSSGWGWWPRPTAAWRRSACSGTGPPSMGRCWCCTQTTQLHCTGWYLGCFLTAQQKGNDRTRHFSKRCDITQGWKWFSETGCTVTVTCQIHDHLYSSY